MADGLSIPDLRGQGLPPILLKSNCKAVYGAGEVSQKLIQRLQVSHTTVVLHQHIYQALQILFRAIVPRRGLFRNELRYFDSFPFTHSPLASWAFGFTSYAWSRITAPLTMRDGVSFLYRTPILRFTMALIVGLEPTTP